MSTQNKAIKTTIPVKPTAPPTSSNSCRPHRSNASLAVPNPLTDSQILDPGSTDEDDESNKDNDNDEDGEIYELDSGREA